MTAAVVTRVKGVSWTSAKAVGIYGIVFGALGFWLALPPLAARTQVLPIAFALVAMALGIWAFSRGEKRVEHSHQSSLKTP